MIDLFYLGLLASRPNRLDVYHVGHDYVDVVNIFSNVQSTDNEPVSTYPNYRAHSKYSSSVAPTTPT